MPESTRLQGTRGENLAVKFLLDKGHILVQRNYKDRVSRGEIDVITRDQDCLVFVEVKAGRPHEFGPPEVMRYEDVPDPEPFAGFVEGR